MTHNCMLTGRLSLKPGVQICHVELVMANFLRTFNREFDRCLRDRSIRLHQEPSGLILSLIQEHLLGVGGATNMPVDELCSQLGPMVHPAGWLTLIDHEAFTAQARETMHFVGADAQALAAAQLVYEFQEYVAWAELLMDTPELSVISNLTMAVHKARDLVSRDTLRAVKCARTIAGTVLNGLSQAELHELLQRTKDGSPDSLETALQSCALA